MYLPSEDVERIFGPDPHPTQHETLCDEVENTQTEAEDNCESDVNPPSIRHMWTYDETVSLIFSVEVFQDQLHHVTKRKCVWQNISNHLSSQDINCTPELCKKKWLNLLKTYKACKDLKGKTGKGPSRFLFFERMDEILGREPNFSSPHTIDLLESTQESDSIESSLDNINSAIDSEQSNLTDEPPRKQYKKGTMSKVQQQLKLIESKFNDKKEREERKLQLLEKKIQLEERKVIALEKIAGIIREVE